ncbi:AGE family epimerase/isomerase [Saccharopolyspora gregorii]|uniref:AGE family epimerase/isomerase n=1 Tax=Saccharopolyspora gregorii TaxID=33914 RepID=UPI0031E6974A
MDRELGSWRHELDEHNRPAATVWEGKPDLYHAYQATLLPRLRPARRSSRADRLIAC